MWAAQIGDGVRTPDPFLLSPQTQNPGCYQGNNFHTHRFAQYFQKSMAHGLRIFGRDVGEVKRGHYEGRLLWDPILSHFLLEIKGKTCFASATSTTCMKTACLPALLMWKTWVCLFFGDWLPSGGFSRESRPFLDSPRKLAAKRLAVRRQAFRRVMAREALLQDAGAPGLPDSELHGDRQNFHLVKTIFCFLVFPCWC